MTATIRTYTDPMGREQLAADGPGGTFLVTRYKPNDFWEVWRSDQLHTRGRRHSVDEAMALAVKLAEGAGR